MIRLPAGLYQPGFSLIHSLDPAVKIACLFLLLAEAVVTKTALGYFLSVAVTAAIVYLAQIDVPTALASLRRLAWFFLLIFLMNTCFYGQDTPFVSWWILHPSRAGLIQGANVVLRLMLMLVLGNVLMSTTSPMKLTAGLERILSPLRIFRVPTSQVAMIISVALQFIPSIFEQTELLKKAQMARGARFDSRSYFEKAAAVMPLIIPTFLAAFKRADELSLAMEARGYRTDVRFAAKKHLSLSLGDYLALTVCAALLAAKLIIF